MHGRAHEPEARAAAARAPAAVMDGVNLLAVALALTGLGLVMVYSTTAVAADRALSDSTYFLRKQLMWALVAGIICVLASATDYRQLLAWSRPLLAVLGAALVLCLFQEGRGGARRWLHLGGMGVQPSELGKIVVVLYLARALERPEVRERFGPLLKVLAGLGVILALVAVEPDFGTALFLAALGGLVLVVGGVKLRHLFATALPALVGGSVLMLTRFDHIKTRIEVFLHPEADLSGKGYQIRQALIALGSGGTSGVGLGESRQKLYFLPDDHTDFILAIVGEELGLVGTLLVVALFAALLAFGLRVALRARDRGGFLLAFGLTAALALQGTMNIAVVTASMPTKGISLPFVSYGGSALCVAMGAVGILLNIDGQSPARGRAKPPGGGRRG